MGDLVEITQNSPTMHLTSISTQSPTQPQSGQLDLPFTSYDVAIYHQLGQQYSWSLCSSLKYTDL